MAKKGKRYSKKKNTPSPQKAENDPLKWLQANRTTIVLVIFFAYILCGTAHFSTELSTIGDNAQLFVLGQSLAKGDGFKTINRPNPGDNTKFPFGFPALIAVFYPIFHFNYLGYKIIIFLFSIGTLYFLFRWFENYSLLFFLSFLLLIALNLKILEYSSLILSETPFLCFVVLGFYLFYRFDKLAKYKYFFLGLLSWGCAYYIRSIGIVLFPALFLYLLFRKEFKVAIAAAVIAAIIITPWQLWTSMHGGASYFKALQMNNPYSPHLGKIGLYEVFTRRIPANFKGYFFTFLPETIIPVFKTQKFQLKDLLAAILSLSVVAGFIIDFWKKWDLKGWYFLGTIAIVLLWPEVWMGERFLFGIIPLIVFYFVYFIYKSIDRFSASRKSFNNLYSAAAIVLIAIPGIMQFNFKNPQTQYTPDWVNYKRSALWIKENTPDDAVIVCRKPYLGYLWSERKTISIPTKFDKNEVYEYFTSQGATHLIFDGFYWSGTTRRYLGPIIKENIPDFPLAYELKNPYTYVLEFKPENVVPDDIPNTP